MLGLCAVNPQSEMNLRESDRYMHVAIGTIFITTAHVVNFGPKIKTAGYISKPINVVIVMDKVDRMGDEKSKPTCKCCLNIHETKINGVNINNFQNSFKM